MSWAAARLLSATSVTITPCCWRSRSRAALFANSGNVDENGAGIADTYVTDFSGRSKAADQDLDVVAPGIAAALVATAAGLAAAIPAVYFYNLLTQRVKTFATDMDDFTLEFLNIVERNFT